MTVEVLIPYAGDCPHRARALAWVREHLPWPVTIAAGTEPWSKGGAVLPAAERSRADALVICDGDVWTSGLQEAVNAVQAGAGWAIPHRAVFRLTEAATAAALTGGPTAIDPHTLELAERPYLGVIGGGIVVLPRWLLLSVPIDPRFIGWGGEDEAWGHALRTMAGPPVRLKRPLVHLWHPPQPRITRRRGSDANSRLLRRYVNAIDDTTAMARLLAEVQLDRRTDQHPVHDHAALR